MHFAKQATFLFLALFTFALALPAPGDVHSLERRWRFRLYIQGIIDIDIRTGKDANNYNATPPATAALQNDTTSIGTSIQTATAAQIADQTATQADSEDLLNFISGSYAPQNNQTVQAVIAQRSKIFAAKQQSLFYQQSRFIQANQTALSNAILAKLPANQTLKAQASGIFKSIDGDMANLVAAFQS